MRPPLLALPLDCAPAHGYDIDEEGEAGFICHPMSFPSLLSASDCQAIIDLAAQQGRSVRADLARPVEGYRRGTTKLIEISPASRWLYERLSGAFTLVNQWYRFDVTGFVDSLLYCEYPADGHFDWHVDCGEGATRTRKISLSLQLSGPETYCGGGLEFAGIGELPECRDLGTVISFPAFLRHRVAPVTLGIRRSLVAWAHGPVFR